MPKKLIIDAGPIVAYLDRSDRFHAWALEQFHRFPAFETCEAALAEACARLEYGRLDPLRAVRLAHEGALKLAFDLDANLGRIVWLMEKYADRPMDLADACLLAMTEAERDSLLITLDVDDFSVYRRNGRDAVPFISPDRD